MSAVHVVKTLAASQPSTHIGSGHMSTSTATSTQPAGGASASKSCGVGVGHSTAVDAGDVLTMARHGLMTIR